MEALKPRCPIILRLEQTTERSFPPRAIDSNAVRELCGKKTTKKNGEGGRTRENLPSAEQTFCFRKQFLTTGGLLTVHKITYPPHRFSKLDDYTRERVSIPTRV